MQETLWDVTFSVNHVIAELFWNAIFAVLVYGFSKARALRKIHKYVDNKHGIVHSESEY